MSTLKTTNLQNADASSANIILGQGSGGGATISGVTTSSTLRATTGIVTSLTAGSLTSLGAVSGTTGTFNGKVGISTGTHNVGDNQLLIRAASSVGTYKGHIMLAGDGATVGEGPQIVFSESGSGSAYAGAYVGHKREGSNSVGTLVFGTRASSGDTTTAPTERLSIGSDGTVTIASEDLVFGTTNKGIEFPNSASVKQNLSNLYVNLASGNNNVEVQSNGTSFVKFRGTNGNVELVDGNIVMSTAGKGIDFSATSDTGGMTNELLDDYEEGTFTPTLGFVGNTNNDWTYNAQQGTYIKVGNLCHFVIRIEINAMGSGSNGWIEINGLPFSMYDMMSGISYEGTTTVDFHDAKINVNAPRAIFDADSSCLKLIDTDAGTSFFNASRALNKNTVLQTNTDIRCRGTYRTT